MSLLQSSSANLPAFDVRSTAEIDQEILDELAFHLEMCAEDNLLAGMSLIDAHAVARKRFGDFPRIYRACRRALLGERIVWQRIQTALTIVLLVAVAWLGMQLYSGQRATETALTKMTTALERLNENSPAKTEVSKHTPPYDWRKDRPVVVATTPESGATDVDPAASEIRIVFSKQMANRSWSWVRTSADTFPEGDGDIHYLDDGKTCVMPVKLTAGKKYVIWINTAKYQNFKDAEGRPAEPYMLTFSTRE